MTAPALPTNPSRQPEFNRRVADAVNSLLRLPGFRSSGQNVITASKTLGPMDNGTNLLILTAGVTITLPASGFASGEGVAISNVSGGNVTLSCPGGSDFGATLPNNG